MSGQDFYLNLPHQRTAAALDALEDEPPTDFAAYLADVAAALLEYRIDAAMRVGVEAVDLSALIFHDEFSAAIAGFEMPIPAIFCAALYVSLDSRAFFHVTGPIRLFTSKRNRMFAKLYEAAVEEAAYVMAAVGDDWTRWMNAYEVSFGKYLSTKETPRLSATNVPRLAQMFLSTRSREGVERGEPYVHPTTSAPRGNPGSGAQVFRTAAIAFVAIVIVGVAGAIFDAVRKGSITLFATKQPQSGAAAKLQVPNRFDPTTARIAAPIATQYQQNAEVPRQTAAWDEEIRLFMSNTENDPILTRTESVTLFNQKLAFLTQQHPQWSPKEIFHEAKLQTRAFLDEIGTLTWDTDVQRFLSANCEVSTGRNKVLFQAELNAVARPGMVNSQLLAAALGRVRARPDFDHGASCTVITRAPHKVHEETAPSTPKCEYRAAMSDADIARCRAG